MVKLDKTKPKSREDDESAIEMRWTHTEDGREIQVGYGVNIKLRLGRKLTSIQR